MNMNWSELNGTKTINNTVGSGGNKMNMNWSELNGTKIRASDGDVGKLKDLYFDDVSFKVRFAMVETGGMLSRKWALLSPQAFGKFDLEAKRLPIDLTKSKIEKSPDVSNIKMLNEKDQKVIYDYFGWASDWYGKKGDLRLLLNVLQYKVIAEDEQIGGLDDVIIDLNTWSVRYLVLNAGSWLAGKKVLVAPQWIKSFSVGGDILSIDLTKNQMEKAPLFDTSKPVTREYENMLYNYYDKKKYWQ